MKRESFVELFIEKIVTKMKISSFVMGLISLVLLSSSNVVFAHAALTKAEPARRAVLTASPKQVRLWFNEEIEADYASLSLHDANGKALTEKKPLVHPDDAKSIYLELPELIGGQYTVKFRVLSVDGHVVDSEYKFTVKNK
ncbi:MAG TPA: copper resistance protein CopC [Nitrosomonas europaea]|uniref:copper resistance CopC family protein n=1 Tax=Nitrosomonas europaea TaxID=915 RepID=UPI0024934668|nr:copper resistance CopC family protein [Nitrosomonas europaea]HRN82754.1 copper resistance protein CopC [Nitrosomonas europaea]HRO57397.1 copper resistance protein CopC [Nitrosomonas europaea]HUM74677.1 copper resistance protein CopC [Nitrosomonas europaea]